MAPSPDPGQSVEGQITWYDYAGKSLTYHSVHRQLETVREYPASGTAYLTTFLYEASTPYRLLAVYHPDGLTTTNTYYPATPLSENSRRLNTVTDLQLNRTRTYTWQGGEVRTLTDERGLVRTFTLDELGRVTRIDYSGTPATYEEFCYTSDGTATGPKILDLTYRRDRLESRGTRAFRWLFCD